jgi:hypothetical protein
LRSGKRVSKADNEQAAAIILADPRRYAGLPVIWAQLWMENVQGIISQAPCGKDPCGRVEHAKLDTDRH